MKKKLVAFAVTAAMVITSAVPVFAQTWGKPADPVQVGNVITIKEETPRTDMAGPVTAEGITFDTVIDLNKDLGSGAWFTVNFTDANQKAVAGKPLYVSPRAGTNTWDIFFGGNTASNVQGIVTLEWTVSTEGIEVAIIQNGYDEQVLATQKTTLPENAVSVSDLTVKPTAGKPVVMYETYPEDVVSFDVVTNYGDKDKQAIATQPVYKEPLTVTNVKLTADTPIADAELGKYVSIQWYADGKAIDSATSATFIPEESNCMGKVVTVKVSGKKTAGVFGTVTWGADTDELAVATRYAGENRYETALAVADSIKNGKFENIVVASGEEYADALSATSFAAKLNAPILLVNSAYEQKVRDYIYENMVYAGHVYIIGGENAVSANFEDSIDKHDVVRLGGADRYATNLKILGEMKEQNLIGDWTMVVSGNGFADALSAASTGQPILMVGDALTKTQKEFLNDIGEKNVVVVGGPLSVSVDVAEEMVAYDKDNKIQRYGGANRYETNYLVLTASGISFGKDNIVLASGEGFADGLVGGALAIANKTGVVLVSDSMTTYAERYAYNNQSANLFVVGGEKSVSNEVVQKVYAQKIAEKIA